MILESFVIFGLIFFMFIISFRIKRKYAFSIIPLLIPPGANIIAYFLASPISKIIPFDDFTTYLIINIISAVLSSVLVGIYSFTFETKSIRRSYLIMSILFNITLVIIFILNFSPKKN